MQCPDTGAWRAWLDGETEAPGWTLDDHLDTCADCQRAVADLRADAAFAADHLAALDPAVTPLPLARPTPATVPAAPATAHTAPAAAPTRAAVADTRPGGFLMLLSRRWRPIAAGLAAAALLTFAVGTPQGQTAAAQFLSQFRSQHFAVISFSPNSDWRGLATLERLGTVTQPPRGVMAGEVVATAADASRRVGFAVRLPDPAALPAGTGAPEIRVTAPATARFTFDRAKARDYFASLGRPDLALPDRLDGASLVVRVPAAVFLDYRGADGRTLIGVAESQEVVVDAERASLDEIRDYLLGLPGLPPDVARQLRAIGDWRTTLPVPVPIDEVQWQQTTIGGNPALILADNSGIGSGVIWHRDNQVFAVAGAARSTDIRRVAESLR